MIKGAFKEGMGYPLVSADLYLPRLSVTGNIRFLVDTGSDTSSIMPRDINRMRIPVTALSGSRACLGVGGEATYFVEPAVLVFTDETGTQYYYRLEIDIAKGSSASSILPSLLGRDVIDRWRLVVDRFFGVLQAEVRTADLIEQP